MIYVASSWRSETQPVMVKVLRGAGFEVYDFRNPAEGRRVPTDRELWAVDELAKIATRLATQNGSTLTAAVTETLKLVGAAREFNTIHCGVPVDTRACERCREMVIVTYTGLCTNCLEITS